MAEVAPSRLLESLPARPPTPPRETSHDREVPLKQVLLASHRNPLDPRSNLQTPPSAQSVLSSAGKTSSTGSARQKKVEFSTLTEYKEPPVYPDRADISIGQHGHITPPVAALPPSSSASRPAKSILKITAYDFPVSAIPNNIADMLASTIQQLIGADRDSRLDAYLMLARALKASDNLPDRIALQSKMSLFTQFIQRDIVTKTPDGVLDSTLVIAALDLLNTFLRFSAIASTIPNEFGVFIMDHCIRSFEVANVPRDVLRSLMRVVYTQSFPAKVMAPERVGRLVAALHRMDEQYESKNIIVMRSFNYRVLVKNQPIMMAVHLDWLQDLLTDMLSGAPHVRSAAIDLGLDAAFALGRERSVSQRVVELLQATVDEERFLDYYANRLRVMTKNKAESQFVPQVWSVVTLFLRNLEKWDFFTEWLRILQGCFNSSDYRTKAEANFAWSRFTYALLRENRPLSKKMTLVLTQALVSQLRRRGTGKQVDDFRKIVLGCVCNLFYYAMRDPKEIDSIWDNSVKPVVLQLLEQSSAEETTREKRKANLASATAILTGLLDCSTARPWKADHIAKSPIVVPEDLPAVDPKWIRRNAERVFALVGPILQQSFLELSTPRSAVQLLWRSVVGAVSVAAAKEVKVSSETAVFVGHAFSTLLKLWTVGVPAQAAGTKPSSTSASNEPDKAFAVTQFLAATREYLLTMVDSLGPLPFTERQLSKDESNMFVPVATPSQRSGKGHSISRTPLRHLFSLFSSLPPGVQDNDDFAEFIESVFAPFFSAKSGKALRSLAYEMLHMSPMDALCPYGPWQVAAARIASTLALQASSVGSAGSSSNSNSLHGDTMGTSYRSYQMSLSPSSASSDPTPAGHEFREVVRVLERGLRSTPNLPWPRWQALFCALCDRVREEAGEAGLAVCVLEPLAKTLTDLRFHPATGRLSTVAPQVLVELISLASHPRDRQAVDSAKRRLWGSAIAASGTTALFDPFDHLYKLVNVALQQLYASYDAQNTASAELAVSLLKELAGFFARTNEQLFIRTLCAVQNGLACWIQDDKAKLNRKSPAAEMTSLLWDDLCPSLEGLNESSSLPLSSLETLLCAAFSSKHRRIVNSALLMWTRIFGGHVGEVDYPEKLKASLSALQASADVAIPGLEIETALAHIKPVDAQQPLFVGTQEDLDIRLNTSSTHSHNPEATTPRPSSKRHTTPVSTPLALTNPSSVNRAANASSKKSSLAKARKETERPTPSRLRHDDSQIEFTTIDSTTVLPSSAAVSATEVGNSNVAGIEESQVLTERQREVRERQRETNALYSDVMSSSPGNGATARKSSSRTTPFQEPSLPEHVSRLELEPLEQGQEQEQEQPPLSPGQEDIALPEQLHAATPDHPALVNGRTGSNGTSYVEEDFIASTPTPRRGQALVFPVVNDNDIDPPSSPPEPRRYPLLPEISTRSRSSSILDEWQFSSSPLSGSPIAARHTIPEPELSLAGVLENSVRNQDEGHGEEQQQAEEPQEQEVTMGATSFPAALEPPISSLDAGRDSDIVMNDAPALDSTAALAASMSQALTVEISPLDQIKNRVKAPSTPMQTRRRTTLSQESPQTSQEADASVAGFAGSAASQTLPRALRNHHSEPSAKGVSQSSPIRRSSGRRRYKLMAIPPPSVLDQSFLISEGDEQSMIRLAIATDILNNRSNSSPVTKRPGFVADKDGNTHDDDSVEALDCITVQTGDKTDKASKNAERSLANSQESSQRSSQGTPSRRSTRGKRKRTASAQPEDATDGAVNTDSHDTRRIARMKRHIVENSGLAFASEDVQEVQASQAANEVAKDANLDKSTASTQHEIVEDDEVHSQLVLELEVLSSRNKTRSTTASEHKETPAQAVVDLTAVADEPDSVVEVTNAPAQAEDEEEQGEEERPAKKTKFAGILSMLKSSLTLLQSAALSRDEVNKIEDVCMDVKRALYDAERRGRE